MQIPMMRTDRLYHVTANWLTNTQKRYTRDFLICAENKQDAEKITRNHIPNQFLTTNNPTDTTDIHIRVRDLGLSQKNRTYYVSPIQKTTRVIADEPSILEETATYFARLFGYEQGALASKSELTDAQSTRLTSLNTLCKDTQMFWKLAGEFLYLKNADPTDFCRKKIEELTNTVNLDELANEYNASSAPKFAPTSIDTSAILDAAKKQANFIIAQAKETAEIIINNAKQTANIIATNATNISANAGAMMSIPKTPQEPTTTYIDMPANIDEELPFAEPDESIVSKKSSEKPEPKEEPTEPTSEPVEKSVDENNSVAEPAPETTSDVTNDKTDNATEVATKSTTEPTTNEETAISSEDAQSDTDTDNTSIENDVPMIENHMRERVSTDIQSIQNMSDETLMGKTLSALQNMSDNEFLTTIADTEFAFDSNITPTEYFESELNKNTDFNDEAKTSTKASILASIKGETDDSMLIDYAIALTVASKNEDTPKEENQFFTDNTDDGFYTDDNESYDYEPSYDDDEPEYAEDNEGNSDI